MSKSTFGGGMNVKASTLQVGNYIRDPRKIDRILIVKEVGSNIFAKGLDESEEKYHIFLNREQYVTKVTQTTTETSKE